MEKRHWLSVPSAYELGEEPTEYEKLFDPECWDLGFRYSEGGGNDLVFKTYDAQEAKRIEDAANLQAKRLGLVVDVFHVSHVLQPHCPACDALARFSSTCCECCGAKLLPKEYVS